ncbi:MAG: glycosyltransferase family A protein [Terracidiphilus sp.]|jgi:GT2 family glycosyltransferase
MPWPSIAVITPVRNGMPFLREAIECVQAQQYESMEIVVVDDGSKDGSGAFARGTGICRVLETPGVGPAAARNVGIRATKSDLLMFLDADDLLGHLALQIGVEALLRAPDAGFAQGCIQNFTARPDGSIHLLTRPYRFINLGSGLWRRSVFETVGLLDESLWLGEDQDFFMRCWERDIARELVDCVTLYYRRHEGNMTRGLKGVEFGLMGIYRKRIERIRRGEYDPNTPRRVSWPDYLGKSPDVAEL